MKLDKGVTMIDLDSAKLFTPGSDISGLTIILMQHSLPAETYEVESGIVTDWELGDMDAMLSAVMIKSFTVAYTNIKISRI